MARKGASPNRSGALARRGPTIAGSGPSQVTDRGMLKGDVFELLTRTIEIGGKKVSIFDGLMSKSSLRALYRLLRGQRYSWNNTDSELHPWSVRWKLEMPKSTFSISPFSEVIQIVESRFSDP